MRVPMILHWKTASKSLEGMLPEAEPERNFFFDGPRNTGLTPEEILDAEAIIDIDEVDRPSFLALSTKPLALKKWYDGGGNSAKELLWCSNMQRDKQSLHFGCHGDVRLPSWREPRNGRTRTELYASRSSVLTQSVSSDGIVRGGDAGAPAGCAATVDIAPVLSVSQIAMEKLLPNRNIIVD
ncbi:hypothetical protein Trydic_g19579 [Trypoxylus dichotomus]